MNQALAPFAITGPIAPDLEAVLHYWQELRRGSAEVPFADDVSITDVTALSRRNFLVEVFTRPERFRLNSGPVGLPAAELDLVLGRFIDEVELPELFDLLRAQCSVTVESLRPTIYAHEPRSLGGASYQRLLVPLWGEGEVRMLLGALG